MHYLALDFAIVEETKNIVPGKVSTVEAQKFPHKFSFNWIQIVICIKVLLSNQGRNRLTMTIVSQFSTIPLPTSFDRYFTIFIRAINAMHKSVQLK